jgi:hypothetical protein
MMHNDVADTNGGFQHPEKTGGELNPISLAIAAFSGKWSFKLLYSFESVPIEATSMTFHASAGLLGYFIKCSFTKTSCVLSISA